MSNLEQIILYAVNIFIVLLLFTCRPSGNLFTDSMMFITFLSFPVECNQKLNEQGYCTYYGAWLDGERTANGERFNSTLLTAGHPSWPFGTMVQVTVDKTTVVVRINDRSPAVLGRVLDVSREAAKKLGFIRRGIVKCHLNQI